MSIDFKENYYTRVRNKLLKIYSPSVVTKVIKKRVELGIYPNVFLNFIIKNAKKNPIRNRFNNRLSLKNEVYKRDDWKCVICFSSKNLEIDHILSLHKYPNRAFDIDNLRLLCKKCHRNKKTP